MQITKQVIVHVKKSMFIPSRFMNTNFAGDVASNRMVRRMTRHICRLVMVLIDNQLRRLVRSVGWL